MKVITLVSSFKVADKPDYIGKETRFFLHCVTGYEKFNKPTGESTVYIYFAHGVEKLESYEWDADSWERFICALGNQFTESEIIPNSTPPAGTKPELNYYY